MDYLVIIQGLLILLKLSGVLILSWPCVLTPMWMILFITCVLLINDRWFGL